LATSLNNLSNRLSDAGDNKGGLAAVQRSVEIREGLAKQNFAAYGPALGITLLNCYIIYERNIQTLLKVKEIYVLIVGSSHAPWVVIFPQLLREFSDQARADNDSKSALEIDEIIEEISKY